MPADPAVAYGPDNASATGPIRDQTTAKKKKPKVPVPFGGYETESGYPADDAAPDDSASARAMQAGVAYAAGRRRLLGAGLPRDSIALSPRPRM